MKFLLSALFAIAASFMSVAADPAPAPVKPAGPVVTMPKEITTKSGKILTIEVKGTYKFIKWRLNTPGADLIPLNDGKTAHFTTANAGEFVVTVVAGNENGLSEFLDTKVIVQANTPPPIPNPPCPPTPPVPPTPPTPPAPPKVENVWVVIVTEKTETDIDQAKVLGNLEFWRGLETRGHQHRVYDKDQVEVGKNGYLKTLAEKNVKLPGLILIDSKGNDLKVVPLPKSTSEIDNLIKEVASK